MLFPEEHENDLKLFLVQKIEKTPDADEVDAEVLADYVLALLKHDGDVESVRQTCVASLPDFLGEGTKQFVDGILEAITFKTYLPNALPPPPPPPPMMGLLYDDDQAGNGYLRQAQAAGQQNNGFGGGGGGNRKRGYNDLDSPATGAEAYHAPAFKQPRRGSAGRGFEQSLPGSSGGGFLDPEYAAKFMFNVLNQPEFMAAAAQNGGGGGGRNKKKKRAPKCRDYVNKGVCPRGFNCRFDHSSDDPAGFGGGGFGQVEEYDPANALMTNTFPQPGAGLPGMLSFGEIFAQSQPKQHNNSHRSKGQGGNRGGRQKRGGGDRSTFSAEGPVSDRTKSTIVVESIPEENFDEDQVRDFFSQFGNILVVKMYPYKRLAVVKFDCWEAANAAYKSPKVIFENRFVKVFWFKDEEQIAPPPGKQGGGVNGGASGQGGEAPPENVPLTEEQLEEIRKRQEEAQKVFEEKMRKREELERKQKDIDERQKELLAAQEELKAKLAKKGEGVGDGEGEGSTSKQPMTQSEALRAQLARLEEEARQIGLDPHAEMDGEEGPAGVLREGVTMAVEGGLRGEEALFLGLADLRREGSGGFRGRADVHAAYAAYSLDNRPKRVVVSGVDFTEGQRDEVLRQYLFGVGEFTHISHSSSPPTTEITFKDRKTAEKFYNSVSLNDYTIPEIEGQVELSWASASSSSTALSTPTASGFTHVNGVATNKSTGATAQNGDEDGHDQDHDGESVDDDRDVRILLDHQPEQEKDKDREQNEMDYEVADDADQWY
ncbi:LOW QUALITY PROTEIN: hypothetical protein QC764_602520 [Podospora pseudoanserina]|uniref:RNA-binding protein n=1 Tax=Podospora pseudoanserina TaxID=2609844 RepID=A0ABR0HTM0_9PEZI|nr:LOW QUALITY PROTEIN: hypothetical protein QC764_602520 [Podospora pseudoanserina]